MCRFGAIKKNTGLRLVQKTLKYQLKVSEVRANRYIKKFKSQKVCHALRHLYVMHCAIWYHFYNLKNEKNTHEGVLLFPQWVFFTFFKLYKWYQIAQYIAMLRRLPRRLLTLYANKINALCPEGNCDLSLAYNKSRKSRKLARKFKEFCQSLLVNHNN